MAYIGTSPSVGEFKKLDDISSQFNDANVSFILQSSGVNINTGSPQNLIISIDGIVQEPSASYTVGGSSITFSEAPNTASTFFGILLGSVGQINVVGDDTISTSKLQNNAVTEVKIATDAVTTAKIADLNVTTGKLAANAITNAKLANDAVTTAKITDGAVNLSGTKVTGTLPVAQGGTGITSLGAGIATFLGTPSSANLATAITDETGTGALVFATSPDLVTPVLGTPTSGNLSNCTVDGTDAVGFRNIPQNSKSAAYTLVLADSGKHIFHPQADNTARTFTIPSNANVNYPIGTAITFINMANTITIAIVTDTLTFSPAGSSGSRTLTANGSATCIKIANTQWLISGSGLT